VWWEPAGCLNARWHPEVVPLPDDRALTVRSTESRPPEVCVLRPGAAARPWTGLNADVATARGIRVTELRWPDPRGGAPIEGLLAVPAGDPGAPWPLVVTVHGGPTLAYHHSWDLGWAEPLTAAGYAVLMPNPCGGAGRGQDFGRGNLGDPAGGEFEQIVAGVGYCVEQGYARAGRVAAMGASYGGYLTAWALARGDVFACGVVIAGISDLATCRDTANNGAFYDFLCRGGPDEQPARYADRSPVNRIGARSRPALILHGELDRCVPVGQARQLLAGLSTAGVPARLVVYPGEGHQTHAIGHLRDQRARVLAWLAEHLPDG
jgi:dipeptidyl aminopeptidase/acylaminoacyl peptidase